MPDFDPNRIDKEVIEIVRLGDSSEVLLDLKDEHGQIADAVVTDPPYGMDIGRPGNEMGERIIGDKTVDEAVAILESIIQSMDGILDQGSPVLFFAGDKNLCKATDNVVEGHLDVQQWLVWDKDWIGPWATDQRWRPNHEHLIFATNGEPHFINKNRSDGDVLKFRRVPGQNKTHPTEKPTTLLRYLIESITDEGDIILDPFAGTGSTLEAAKETGRGYIGIEIDEDFYEIMVERLKD